MLLIERRENGKEDKITVLDAIRLIKDAWDSVKPLTVSNCFNKSGLNDESVSTNQHSEEEVFDEEDLPLSQWLKLKRINNFSHVEDLDDFASIDEDLVTSGIPSEEDILQAVLQQEDSEDEDENVQEILPVVSYSQAQAALEILTQFSENNNTPESVFTALSVIRGNIRDIKLNSMKQTSILNYINK